LRPAPLSWTPWTNKGCNNSGQRHSGERSAIRDVLEKWWLITLLCGQSRLTLDRLVTSKQPSLAFAPLVSAANLCLTNAIATAPNRVISSLRAKPPRALFSRAVHRLLGGALERRLGFIEIKSSSHA
jgi:hypothetical protein